MLFSHIYRHGSLFKSHILGCPTVVCMDPELNRFILMNEGKGFIPGYPQSMLDVLGRSNIAAVHGSLHKIMRSVMLGLVSPPLIRDQLLPKIDEFMRSYIDDWNGRVIDIQEKTKEVSQFPILLCSNITLYTQYTTIVLCGWSWFMFTLKKMQKKKKKKMPTAGTWEEIRTFMLL